MIGKKVPTSKLFYQFSLEDRVPADHLLRRVATAVDLSFVRRLTERFYSHTGQPSVDPIVIFKMALLSYLYGITSERRLVQEISLNLAYLWFIGYDLDEPVPDHSALSKARRRFGPTTYLGFFKEIVRQCEQAGLIRGNKLYVDSTLVQADADSDSIGSRALVAQLRDIGTHVNRLWQDNPDSPSAEDEVATTDSAANAKRSDLAPSAQIAQSDTALPAQSEAGPLSSKSIQPIADAEPQSHDSGTGPRYSLHLAGPTDPSNKVIGLLNERMVSRVDPEAELVQRARVLAGLYYKVHAGVDAGRARIVTAVDVTGGGIADEYLLERIIREHEGNVGRHVNEVVADAKYGTADNYRRLEQLGIRGSIPMRENSADSRAVPARLFKYDEKSDTFICPSGQPMTRQGITTKTAAHPLVIYRAGRRQCAGCESKEACCGKAKARSVSRVEDGGVRKRAGAYLATNQARQSIRYRKAWVETIFGDGKERRGLRRADCRGLDWMRVQAYMTAIVQDVRQLALCKKIRPENGVGALEKDRRLAPVGLVACINFELVANNHDLTLTLFLN